MDQGSESEPATLQIKLSLWVYVVCMHVHPLSHSEGSLEAD